MVCKAIAFEKMFLGTANYCHILKARIVVAYALFCVFGQCSGTSLRANLRFLVRNILFSIRHPIAYFNKGFPKKTKFRDTFAHIKETYNTLYRKFFKEYTAHRKTPLSDYAYVKMECTPMGSYFYRIIGTAWLCEKLGLNVKFTFPDTYVIGSTNFFENTVLSYARACDHRKFVELKKPLVELDYRNNWTLPSLWDAFARYRLSNEYGHKIISMLSIKQEIREQADRWYRKNIKGKCVGVHYRQTDAFDCGHIISVSSYIDYLRQVLDDCCKIYACSDNAQFIDTMHKEFPDRVVSRDITRSRDRRSLHRHEGYAGDQQRKDALIDILVLARLGTIYTVGSQFIDITRFFNPAIEIISLDRRGEKWYGGRFPNYLPVPKWDLVVKARRDTAWKEPLLAKGYPPDIEYKRR